MPRITIVVADAVRARFFTYEPDDQPGRGAGGRIVEHDVLVNPERRLRDADRIGDRLGNDDHRDQHVHELDERFAAEIVGELGRSLAALPAQRLVVAAGPQMLGILRRTLGALGHRGIEIDELALDLTRETPTRLHDHLASLSLVPPRSRVHGAVR